MTREEAIRWLEVEKSIIREVPEQPQGARELTEAYDMAIEALQADAVSLTGTMKYLTKPHNYCEVVRCKDCRHQEHCHETVAHTKEHEGFREHWSETIEWCSRGERKGGDSE